MAQPTLRQRVMAQAYENMDANEWRALARAQSGFDPQLLDALLEASTHASFGPIPRESLERIAREGNTSMAMVGAAAKVIDQYPPHLRDAALAAYALGGAETLDVGYVNRLAGNYATIAAADRIQQKRAEADAADKTQPRYGGPSQRDRECRAEVGSRRAAVEAAFGVDRSAEGLVNRVRQFEPEMREAAANVIDNSAAILAHPEASMRDAVAAAYDAHHAMDIATEVLGMDETRPSRQD